MNQHEDSLEAELTSWKPAPVSEKLKQRIGRGLSPIVLFRRRTWLITGTLAAACLLAAVLLLIKKNDHAGLLPTASIIAEETIEPTDQPPSLQTYSRALNQSTEALDALLDRHAVSNTSSRTTLQAFPLSLSPFTN